VVLGPVNHSQGPLAIVRPPLDASSVGGRTAYKAIVSDYAIQRVGFKDDQTTSFTFRRWFDHPYSQFWASYPQQSVLRVAKPPHFHFQTIEDVSPL
jgi:hypothetical protein